MVINKNRRNEIKKKYPKNVYKTLLRIHSTQALDIDDNELNIFLEVLSKYDDKKTLNDILIFYKKNPILSINWIIKKESFNIDEINIYIDIFGVKLLSCELESILNIDIYHENILPFFPYLKDNSDLLHEINDNKSFIYLYGRNDISSDIIANHLDNYMYYVNKCASFGNVLTIDEVNTLCGFDNITFKKIYLCKDLLHSVMTEYKNHIYADMLLKFIISNPSYIDNVIDNVKEKKHKFNITNFLNSFNDKSVICNFVNCTIDNKEYFENQRDLLYTLLFSGLRSLLNDMIDRKNKCGITYNDEINNYLECFIKWKNAKNTDDLKEVFDYYENNKLVDHNKMMEYAIIEYNKYLNIFISKTNDIRNSDNVTFTFEDYHSEKYNKSGKIEILELHGVPFNYLGHVIVEGKSDNQQIFADRNKFITKLRKNPHLWCSSPEHGTDYISTSLGNDMAIKNFGVPAIIICFDHVHDKQIKSTKGSDAYTPLDPGTKIDNSLNLISPEELIYPNSGLYSDSYFLYNELVSSREGIMPNYILVASKPNAARIPLLNDEIREWALYYDIPIHRIDCDAYFKKNYETFIEYRNKLKNSKTIPTLEELRTLFGLQTSAYQYTTDMPEKTFDIIFDVIDIDNKTMNDESIKNLEYLLFLLNSYTYSSDINNDITVKKHLNFLNNYVKENKNKHTKK